MKPYYADERVCVFHDDALQVLLELGAAAVDAVITDPPYSSGGQYRGDRVQRTSTKYLGDGRPEPLPDFGGDNRDQRSYAYWCQLWLAQALRVTKPGGILTVATDWRQLPTTTDAVQAGGWTWRGILAWAKPDPRPQLGRPAQACEFIVWATNGPRKIEGDALPGWWLLSTPRDRQHQTQKPLRTYRDLAQLVPPDGLILDPFMGSGTTGVAALLEGRRFIGSEMSAEYVERTVARLRAVDAPDGEHQGSLFDQEAMA
jgi:site-specific DNA-methyltransferase (adenine-specific)